MKIDRLVFLILAIMLCSDIEAQILRSIGVKTGAVAANQDWDYANPSINVDFDTRWGYDIGAFGELLNNPYISVLIEIHYVQKGFKDVSTWTYEDGTEKDTTAITRVDYISIPFLVKPRLETNNVSFYGIVGPRFDALIATKNTENYGSVLDEFKKTEFGATFGVGIVLTEFDPLQIGAEFRYSPSLQKSYSTQYLTVENRSIEVLFSIGYKISQTN